MASVTLMSRRFSKRRSSIHQIVDNGLKSIILVPSLVSCPDYFSRQKAFIHQMVKLIFKLPYLNNGTRRCLNVVFWSKKGRDVDNVISTSRQRGFTNVYKSFRLNQG